MIVYIVFQIFFSYTINTSINIVEMSTILSEQRGARHESYKKKWRRSHFRCQKD